MYYEMYDFKIKEIIFEKVKFLLIIACRQKCGRYYNTRYKKKKKNVIIWYEYLLMWMSDDILVGTWLWQINNNKL